MPVLVGEKPRVLVRMDGKCVLYHMYVVTTMSLEGVPLPMATMSFLLGRSRA
jgi:hypothetical protein